MPIVSCRYSGLNRIREPAVFIRSVYRRHTECSRNKIHHFNGVFYALNNEKSLCKHASLYDPFYFRRRINKVQTRPQKSVYLQTLIPVLHVTVLTITDHRVCSKCCPYASRVALSVSLIWCKSRPAFLILFTLEEPLK
jgi:hypothetical protein